MIKEIKTERIPIKMWLDDLEDGALLQAKNLANLPFSVSHIALMPDCHQGYGMPIGGVLATQEVIIPNAVGVDIGCGMCAVRTSLNNPGKDRLKEAMSKIRQLIPLGFKHHATACPPELMPPIIHPEKMIVVKQEYHSATFQLGSLGGGNHFIEIQEDTQGCVWVMIHSGSRNIGKKVADYYNRQAVDLNEKWKSPVQKQWQLAYLPLEHPMAENYLAEMQYCVDFAFASRSRMMQSVLEALDEVTTGFSTEPIINIAHNYASFERHFGQEVVVHRKGATKASLETIGIIPGSQGTNSYIVRGKGSSESFESCSHGAGRVMGRKEACRQLDLKQEIKRLEEKGIIHGIRSKNDLEEASGAYKPIDKVMEFQKDLVDILYELKPLAVVKG